MLDDWINADGRSLPVQFGAGQSSVDLKRCSAEETVKAAYRQVLKREADATGLQDRAGSLIDGTRTVRDLVRELLQSEEWKSTFLNGHTVPDILLALYSSALARAPDRIGWNDFMALGARDEWDTIIDQFLNSSEYAERFGNDTVPGQERQSVPKSSLSVTAP